MWEYNCPKYKDFSKPLSSDDSGSDAYFDHSHDESSDLHSMEWLSLEDNNDHGVMKEIAVPNGRTSKSSKGQTSITHEVGFCSSSLQQDDEKENECASEIQNLKVIVVPNQKGQGKPKQKPKVAGKAALKGGEGKPCIPYKSMAQFVTEFHNKTPLRYRTKPLKACDGPSLHAVPLKRTVPRTPQLRTRMRAASKCHSVQATESTADVQKSLRNEPKVQMFAPVKRSSLKQRAEQVAAENEKMLTDTLRRLDEVKDSHPVHRSRRSTSLPVNRGVGTKVPGPRPRSTTPKPFSFQKRDEEARLKKEIFVQEELRRSQENISSFRARPVPNLTKTFKPKKAAAPLTEPEPFHLLSEVRHQQSLQLLADKQRQLEKVEEESKKFKARGCNVVHQQPFHPKLSGRHTVPNNIQLHSCVRAEERYAFDSKMREALKKKEEEAAEIARVQQLLEEMELKEERKKRIHKARPVPQFLKAHQK